jgi:hypothetical protein
VGQIVDRLNRAYVAGFEGHRERVVVPISTLQGKLSQGICFLPALDYVEKRKTRRGNGESDS